MTTTRRPFAIAFAVILLSGSPRLRRDVTLPNEGEAASIRVADGDEQIGPVGSPLADEVVVQVLDTRGLPVADQEVTFSIAEGAGSVEPVTVETNAQGFAATTWTLGPAAGEQSLRAQTPRGGSTATLEVFVSATAVAGSGSILSADGGVDQSGPVNSALADSLRVRATDALGNPVANVEVTWAATGGGSVSSVTVTTGADGRAAVERVLGPVAGPQGAQATVAGFTGSPVQFTHTAVPANPTALILLSGDNQSAPAGLEVAGDLEVRLEDADHNGIGGRPITWVVPSGSGSVNPVSTTTNVNGIASTRWTLPSNVGSFTVSAVFSGLPAVQFSATATADVPTTIELSSGNGQSAPVGTAVTNPLVVLVTDANDNPVENVSVAWTAVGSGSVSEDNTATDANGLARVTRILGLAPGTYTTTAAVDGLAGSPVTFTSVGTVGPPAQLAILTQPGASTTSGSAFAPAPVIQVEDAQGNPVSQGGIGVTATISSGQTGATLENDQRNTGPGGRATFNNLRITGPPDDDYVLTFTAVVGGGNPLQPVSTGQLTVTAGGADRILILTQPSASAQNGTNFGVQPVVQVVDGTGNPVSGNRTIQVELGEGDGDGTLSGTLTSSTGGGSTATFSGLRITGDARAYTLIFSSGALTPAESNTINITVGPPSSLSISAGGNPQNAPVGTAVPIEPAVLVTDQSGNPISGVNVDFDVTAGGGTVCQVRWPPAPTAWPRSRAGPWVRQLAPTPSRQACRARRDWGPRCSPRPARWTTVRRPLRPTPTRWTRTRP